MAKASEKFCAFFGRTILANTVLYEAMDMAGVRRKSVSVQRTATLGIGLPAKNEAAAPELLDRLRSACPNTKLLLVEDGSTGDKAQVAH